MILGFGIDIVEVARVRQALERHGDSFLRRVYTAAEIAESQSRVDARLHQYLAGRWAAKEAFSKALGTGIGASCAFQDIETLNDASGRPVASLSGPAAPAADGVRAHVSISHEAAYAVAVALIESNPCPGPLRSS